MMQFTDIGDVSALLKWSSKNKYSTNSSWLTLAPDVQENEVALK